jgi:hypothetical protein
LFVKDDAKHGVRKLFGPSEAVRASLGGNVKQGARARMDEEYRTGTVHEGKRASEGGAAFVEDIDGEKKVE